MKKEQFLAHWKSLTPNQPVKPEPVPYKHEGSTFGEDGIRICGSPAFIDAVLSRLKDLLEYENGTTRLQVSYRRSEGKPGKPLGREGWNCYIQVHERGRESRIAHAIMGRR